MALNCHVDFEKVASEDPPAKLETRPFNPLFLTWLSIQFPSCSFGPKIILKLTAAPTSPRFLSLFCH